MDQHPWLPISRPPEHTGHRHSHSLASILHGCAPLSFRPAPPAKLEPRICTGTCLLRPTLRLHPEGGKPTPRMSAAHRAMVPRVSCSLRTAPPPLLSIYSKPQQLPPADGSAFWFTQEPGKCGHLPSGALCCPAHKCISLCVCTILSAVLRCSLTYSCNNPPLFSFYRSGTRGSVTGPKVHGP